MAHRNTAYWPERYTPASLCHEARSWRERAAAYLDAAARTAAHAELRKNADRAARTAAESPTAAHLNAAGSMGHQVADSAGALAADLAALAAPCPEPPASAIVYREPDVDGEPESWAAEAITHDEPIRGQPGAFQSRALASLRVHGHPSRAAAVEALRAVALDPEVVRASQGADYHAARVRAAARAALEAEPAEVRIRLAGRERPEDWEAVR